MGKYTKELIRLAIRKWLLSSSRRSIYFDIEVEEVERSKESEVVKLTSQENKPPERDLFERRDRDFEVDNYRDRLCRSGPFGSD